MRKLITMGALSLSFALSATTGVLAQEYTFKLHHLLGAKAPAQTKNA